uniref:Uncharacterized protein n=1 Tax=Lutzomyia longipalpis TaxID=7200 RepID=A0A1B0CCG2_LUTLO
MPPIQTCPEGYLHDGDTCIRKIQKLQAEMPQKSQKQEISEKDVEDKTDKTPVVYDCPKGYILNEN